MGRGNVVGKCWVRETGSLKFKTSRCATSNFLDGVEDVGERGYCYCMEICIHLYIHTYMGHVLFCLRWCHGEKRRFMHA